MTRRRRKSAQSQLTWTPDLAEMFLAPATWTPPGSVKVWRARHHITMTARFVTPMGFVSTAKVRLERDCVVGDLVVVESSLSQTLTVAARAEVAP